MNITEEINILKEQKNAIILAHNYQLGEVQDIADILGDSLDLSKQAKNTDKEIIIFAGVRFMAETAKILSPHKKILLPVYGAGCPMADMVTAKDLINFKKEFPDYAIVSYVNTTAEVKAVSDVCCTSANAVKIVQNYPSDKILFVPDKNLGSYVKEKVIDKDIKLWNGFCNVHLGFNVEDVKKSKEKYPEAVLMVHPEVDFEIRKEADYIFSTNQMVKFVKESDKKDYLVGTEEGMIYRLKKENPEKNFYPAGNTIVCENMKKTHLEDIFNSLKYEKYEIILDDEIIKNAYKSLDKMLEYSN